MPNKEDLLHSMLRIRMVEQEIVKRYKEGKMRTPVHLSIGQEAQAVGVCSALKPQDQVVSTHRSHAHYLAKGGSLNALIAELYGKDTGCSKGYGGSMHLTDRSCGFVGSTSIVGGTIPVGVGLAWAKKLKKEDGHVVVFMGDAALEQGVFHEAANFAGLHHLPITFVVEDNQYSCYTHKTRRQPYRSVQTIAQMYGMHWVNLDSQDPEVIHNLFFESCVDRTSLIYLETWRHLEHCGPNNDDHLGYRDKEEVEYWMARDPLKGVPNSPFIQKEIDEAFKLAELAPWPQKRSDYVYAEPLS
jgi:TPP-dependent pyruvate/acetoin dehydrogenase alpha subunit